MCENLSLLWTRILELGSILSMKSNGCSLKWKEKRGTSFVHLKIKLLALPVIRINICSLNTHPKHYVITKMCIHLLGTSIITVRCIYTDVRGIYLLGAFICEVCTPVRCVYICTALGGVGHGNSLTWTSLWTTWGHPLLAASWRAVQPVQTENK